MKIRKMAVAIVLTLTALSLGAQVFAADQTRDQVRDPIKIKDGSCK
jgi:class 3 adenylate cyclase